MSIRRFSSPVSNSHLQVEVLLMILRLFFFFFFFFFFLSPSLSLSLSLSLSHTHTRLGIVGTRPRHAVSTLRRHPLPNQPPRSDPPNHWIAPSRRTRAVTREFPRARPQRRSNSLRRRIVMAGQGHRARRAWGLPRLHLRTRVTRGVMNLVLGRPCRKCPPLHESVPRQRPREPEWRPCRLEVGFNRPPDCPIAHCKRGMILDR